MALRLDDISEQVNRLARKEDAYAVPHDMVDFSKVVLDTAALMLARGIKPPPLRSWLKEGMLSVSLEIVDEEYPVRLKIDFDDYGAVHRAETRAKSLAAKSNADLVAELGEARFDPSAFVVSLNAASEEHGGRTLKIDAVPGEFCVFCTGLNVVGIRYLQASLGPEFSSDELMRTPASDVISKSRSTIGYAMLVRTSDSSIKAYAMLHFGRLNLGLTPSQAENNEREAKRVKSNAYGGSYSFYEKPSHRAVYVSTLHASPQRHGHGSMLVRQLHSKAFAAWFSAKRYLFVCVVPTEEARPFWIKMEYAESVLDGHPVIDVDCSEHGDGLDLWRPSRILAKCVEIMPSYARN